MSKLSGVQRAFHKQLATIARNAVFLCHFPRQIKPLGAAYRGPRAVSYSSTPLAWRSLSPAMQALLYVMR